MQYRLRRERLPFVGTRLYVSKNSQSRIIFYESQKLTLTLARLRSLCFLSPTPYAQRQKNDPTCSPYNFPHSCLQTRTFQTNYMYD